MAQEKLKMVRALRTGSYDGHRRRAGAVFPVRANAKEVWFEDVSEAVPEGTELPSQIQNVQPLPRKGFTEVMKEMGRTDLEVHPNNQTPMEPVPLSQAQVEPPVATGEDLV